MNTKEIKDLTDRLPVTEELGPGQPIAETAEITFRDTSSKDGKIKRWLVYVAGVSHGKTFGDKKKRLGFSLEAGLDPYAGPLLFKGLEDEIIAYTKQ